MGLTGKDTAMCLNLTWERLSPVSRVLHEELANQLNDRYISPLQELIQDWQELVQAHDEVSAMSLTEIEDWYKEWEELKKRTAQVLREEQKVGK